MNLYKSIKNFISRHAAMTMVLTTAIAGSVAFGTVSYGQAINTNSTCLDGSRYQSFRVNYASRTTGTLSTADGKPLCKDAPMLFQSFDFAETWDGKNFLTSLPQTMHGYTKFTFPGGKSNHKMTVSVVAPDQCKPTQIDFYTGLTIVREIPKSNPHMGEDREVRSGKIYDATEKCQQPVYSCVSLSRIQKDRASFTFRAKARVAGGATLKGFTYELGDGTKQYVAHTKHAADTSEYKYVDLNHAYKKAGTYQVKVTGHFVANGKTVTATSANCQKPVTVKEKPVEPKPPVVKTAKCVSLTAERVGIKSFELRAKADVSGGATISEYSFTIRNVPTKQPSTDPIYYNQRVTSTAESVSVKTGNISTLRAGKTYLASVSVRTSEGVKTSPNCSVKITTGEEPKPELVEVCNTETGVIEKVTKDQADQAPYTTDLTKCDDIEVCNPETGEIITAKKSEADEYAPVDSADCKEKPVVVTELPQTGLTGQLTSLVGLGTLTTAALYYATTRRNG